MELSILTHDGNSFVAVDDNYDADVMNDDLNNAELNTVKIGGLIFSRINVKSIVPTTP